MTTGEPSAEARDRAQPYDDVRPPAEHELGAASIVRRWPTGVALVLGALVLADGRVGETSVAVLVVAMALVYPVVGAVRRDLDRPAVLLLEVGGVVGFGALALAALLSDRDVTRYLLAVALLNHGAWDVAHYLADRVVPRPYAELCAVFDVIVGVAVVALP